MSGARISWLGHATVLLELDGVRLLTDPVLGRRVGPLVRVSGEPVEAAELGRIDSVLLSHLHADHADLGSLRRLRAPVIGPSGAGEWLRGAGIEDVRELSPGAEATAGCVQVIATPAVHDDRRRPLGRHAEPIGFVVRGSLGVYFAGDTDLFEGMGELRGTVDVALLPVWGWGPSVGEGHLDPQRAAQAVAMIGPKLAIPIHWGTFALPWARDGGSDRHAREFAELAAELAPEVEVRVLVPGESAEL
ncbi:MAG TPA: MBL fold metallo-hydrolase [Solirubrobacteraceae bacterium]|nr:MBL fold metallo-hydrolase [Solirubrobacteraceae bacterium]